MAVNYINIFQSMYGPRKITQIGIIGLKIKHLATLESSCRRQDKGDQIERIFAYCAIVFFGHFLKNTEGVQLFVLPFSTEKAMY
jgi:hypothetical protein